MSSTGDTPSPTPTLASPASKVPSDADLHKLGFMEKDFGSIKLRCEAVGMGVDEALLFGNLRAFHRLSTTFNELPTLPDHNVPQAMHGFSDAPQPQSSTLDQDLLMGQGYNYYGNPQAFNAPLPSQPEPTPTYPSFNRNGGTSSFSHGQGYDPYGDEEEASHQPASLFDHNQANSIFKAFREDEAGGYGKYEEMKDLLRSTADRGYGAFGNNAFGNSATGYSAFGYDAAGNKVHGHDAAGYNAAGHDKSTDVLSTASQGYNASGEQQAINPANTSYEQFIHHGRLFSFGGQVSYPLQPTSNRLPPQVPFSSPATDPKEAKSNRNVKKDNPNQDKKNSTKAAKYTGSGIKKGGQSNPKYKKGALRKLLTHYNLDPRVKECKKTWSNYTFATGPPTSDVPSRPQPRTVESYDASRNAVLNDRNLQNLIRETHELHLCKLPPGRQAYVERALESVATTTDDDLLNCVIAWVRHIARIVKHGVTDQVVFDVLEAYNMVEGDWPDLVAVGQMEDVVALFERLKM